MERIFLLQTHTNFVVVVVIVAVVVAVVVVDNVVADTDAEDRDLYLNPN